MEVSNELIYMESIIITTPIAAGLGWIFHKGLNENQKAETKKIAFNVENTTGTLYRLNKRLCMKQLLGLLFLHDHPAGTWQFMI